MHEFKETKSPSQTNTMKYVGLLFVIVLLGIGTGFGLTKVTGNSTGDPSAPDYSVSKGKSFGVSNTKDFQDQATGTIKVGGIEGEGAYHLERPGGESQNVYMTSSLVDLSQFVGKKVKVWGETQAAEHAGWLMDVGKVEVL